MHTSGVIVLSDDQYRLVLAFALTNDLDPSLTMQLAEWCMSMKQGPFVRSSAYGEMNRYLWDRLDSRTGQDDGYFHVNDVTAELDRVLFPEEF